MRMFNIHANKSDAPRRYWHDKDMACNVHSVNQIQRAIGHKIVFILSIFKGFVLPARGPIGNYGGGEGVNTLCTSRISPVKVGNYQEGLKYPRSTFRVAYDYLGTTWGTFGAWRGNLTPCVRF
jgi:hypothetical protein